MSNKFIIEIKDENHPKFDGRKRTFDQKYTQRFNNLYINLTRHDNDLQIQSSDSERIKFRKIFTTFYFFVNNYMCSAVRGGFARRYPIQDKDGNYYEYLVSTLDIGNFSEQELETMNKLCDYIGDLIKGEINEPSTNYKTFFKNTLDPKVKSGPEITVDGKLLGQHIFKYKAKTWDGSFKNAGIQNIKTLEDLYNKVLSYFIHFKDKADLLRNSDGIEFKTSSVRNVNSNLFEHFRNLFKDSFKDKDEVIKLYDLIVLSKTDFDIKYPKINLDELSDFFSDNRKPKSKIEVINLVDEKISDNVEESKEDELRTILEDRRSSDPKTTLLSWIGTDPKTSSPGPSVFWTPSLVQDQSFPGFVMFRKFKQLFIEKYRQSPQPEHRAGLFADIEVLFDILTLSQEDFLNKHRDLINSFDTIEEFFDEYYQLYETMYDHRKNKGERVRRLLMFRLGFDTPLGSEGSHGDQNYDSLVDNVDISAPTFTDVLDKILNTTSPLPSGSGLTGTIATRIPQVNTTGVNIPVTVFPSPPGQNTEGLERKLRHGDLDTLYYYPVLVKNPIRTSSYTYPTAKELGISPSYIDKAAYLKPGYHYTWGTPVMNSDLYYTYIPGVRKQFGWSPGITM